jgi:hypothetical protein
MTMKMDERSAMRRALDEQIASEPQLPPLNLPNDAASSPLENHLRQIPRHPLAVMGIVENGLVRPLDPSVELAEQSRVIIVASEAM